MEMGIGPLGGSQLVFKRKFRWTFEVQEICGGQSVPQHFVKTTARPSLSIEETEINFLNAKSWIPGKAAWETIEVTYLDVATNANAPLWNWIASIYDFTDPVTLKQASQRRDYGGRGLLRLWDGCGTLLETWTLNDMWPTSINFNDLDYSNTEICEITLTLRYSNIRYVSACPTWTPNKCCSPCTGDIGSWGRSSY